MSTKSPEVQKVINQLNGESRGTRFNAAQNISELIRSGNLSHTPTSEVNNHVHTIYSFSPYSPTMAAFKAWDAGLQTVGIMDHDSVAGCEEMLSAGEAIGIAATVGFEMRVNFSGTNVEGRRLNNPDSDNIAYMAIHGIPKQNLPAAVEFLEPVRQARNIRNRAMVKSLNYYISPWNIGEIDFQEDVYNESMAEEGGSITERHLMWALSKKIVERIGKGKAVVSFLQDEMEISVPQNLQNYLTNEENPHYLYDLLGVLKSTLLNDIYIQPDFNECISVFEAVDFAHQVQAIPAYAYLGDVTESPTGDKKAQKFEDDYLDMLVPELKKIGFDAVTYMPPRNTREQLLRLRHLCEENELMEISGVDINSSRQSFNCPIILEDDFRHLEANTWALIAHEKLASHDATYGLFHPENPLAEMSLPGRIKVYTTIGRKIDPTDTGKIWEVAKPIIEENV